MAEGYDGALGCARALIESAENDRAMFMAMLASDAREVVGMREGTLNEAAVTALNEASVSGIWKKIKEIFAALVAKVKSIAHNFLAKFRSLYMKDKDLVKKYGAEVSRKTNIGNLQIKWRKVKEADPGKWVADAPKTLTDLAAYSGDTEEELWKNIFGESDASEFREWLDGQRWEEESADTVKLSEVTSISKIISYLEGAAKVEKDFNNAVNKATKAFEKNVKEADKNANDAAKNGSDDEIKNADRVYKAATIDQSAFLVTVAEATNFIKKFHAQNKAAFMKAVAANNKKLEENAVYLDAVAEAAEQEVEDVITGAFADEEISKVNSASLNVKDADISDDPDKLTYGPDSYTDDYKKTPVDGEIDSTVVGKCDGKCESSIFSDLLY
jgi:hypothetical protein